MTLKGKKVLVTGADGFIGSHLTERLISEGAIVKAFCCYNSFNSRGWIDAFDHTLTRKVDIFMGDVRDPNGVREAMKGVDIVFHLAALIGIPFSYHSPDSYVDTNIKGTLNVLQAARDLRTSKIFITSTSEVYGSAQYVPMDEKHPLQGQSPYSASKIGADMIAESFYRAFALPVTIVRPFNTYGPRQSRRAIIPTIIDQIIAGNREIMLGSTTPHRDFTFVKDTVEGFIRIAGADGVEGEAINIASSSEISIAELVKKISTIMGKDITVVNDTRRIRPEKSEVERLLGDTRKLYDVTGWKPSIALEDGLKITVEWFKHRNSGLKEFRANEYAV